LKGGENLKKLTLTIEEKLMYTRHMTIEVDPNMSEDQLNRILDHAQKNAEHPDDLSIVLERQGIKTIKDVDSDLSSPDDCEIEIFDYNEVKEDQE
jgi:hypothetical protein